MDKNMDVGDIPVAAIDLAVPLTIPGIHKQFIFSAFPEP